MTIEYQVGVRSANGKFTVNLISDGKLTRLSMIKPTRFAKIVNRVFGEYDPWWKGILLPKDRWWKLSRSQHEMDSILKTTIKELENYGLSWSESDSAT